MTNNQDNKDYEIGYGKPPKANQFKPGQSGNYKGRPKASKNIQEAFAKTLLDSIEIKEGNKKKKICILDAVVKKIISSALQGNTTSLKEVIRICDSMPMRQAINEQINGNKPVEMPSKEVQSLVDDMRQILMERHIEQEQAKADEED